MAKPKPHTHCRTCGDELTKENRLTCGTYKNSNVKKVRADCKTCYSKNRKKRTALNKTLTKEAAVTRAIKAQQTPSLTTYWNLI